MLAFISTPFVFLSFFAIGSFGLPLPARQEATGKLVVAHHMVGNTFPYTQQDWADDMALASANGIDGFALNYGPEEFNNDQLDNAYAAAAQFPDFKLFLSMDMSVLPCDSPEGGQALRDKVLKYADNPNQLQVNGKTFVSTFAGESCNFGAASVPEGWSSQFSKHPDLDGKITFAPAFFIDPTGFSDFGDVMDGSFNFNGGWPIGLKADQFNALNADQVSAEGVTEGDVGSVIGSTTSDDAQRAGLESISGKFYMTAVSPWFFTHFGADSFNKNFMFLGDEHLYARRWENLIATRDSVDIVQIATWNDWGESHYISPVKAASALPKGSEQWVNGMPHDGFLPLTKFFAESFKSGQTAPSEDTVVLVSRPHPVQAEAPDPVGRPTDFDLTRDKMWATVVLKEPATVEIKTSDTNVLSSDLPAGVSKLSLPIAAGESMSANIVRGGQSVVETAQSNFTFNATPQSFNFNSFVLGASA
ncbi:glycoside hydrolase [Flagelloscypha sp. PMI_526]|nr:glycoside hydrolase [Flagelloscypha sp. PMI_526]